MRVLHYTTTKSRLVLSVLALALALAQGCASAGDGGSQADGISALPPPAGGTTTPATGSSTPPSSTPPTGSGGALPAGGGSVPPSAGLPMAGSGVGTGSGGIGGSSVPPSSTTMAGTSGGVAGADAPMTGLPGSGAPAMAGPMSPTIPAVTADCPAFTNTVITFMGLGGIEVKAGAKPASASGPMVFYWHGTGGLAGEYALQAGAVANGAIGEGGVLISFQDTVGGDLLSGTFIFGAGDFDLADQLVACAVRDHNVDPRQIFATGCSAGGLFSTAMAAERSNYMAAAAPNSGGFVLPVPFQNGFTPALMTIHGAPGIDVVVIDFSDSSATADMEFKKRGGFVINCNHGGGHCGGGGFAGDIWTFFKAHPYGLGSEPWSSLPPGFNSACQIY